MSEFKKNSNSIALTLGEPAGIGVDCVLKLAEQGKLNDVCIFGSKEHIYSRAKAYKVSSILDSLCIENIPLAKKVTPGVLDPANNSYVFNMLDAATKACLTGKFKSLVTAPVHKAILNETNPNFFGHTEYLQSACKVPNVLMLLASNALKVALVTTHIPINQVHKYITTDAIINKVKLLHLGLKKYFNIKQPRICITGLNPHAGEAGKIGNEELEIIIPAIKKLSLLGFSIEGPASADTLFVPNNLSNIDAVLAMYHDQGLSPLKALYFNKIVNVTLGLPFLRTSPDHGTALDIAGTFTANSDSLELAINWANKK